MPFIEAIFYICLAVFLPMIPAKMAVARGRDYWKFYWLSWLLSPFIMIAVVYFLGATQEQQIIAGEKRRCPECKEIIQFSARTCPHCKSRLAALKAGPAVSTNSDRPPMSAARREELEAKMAAFKASKRRG